MASKPPFKMPEGDYAGDVSCQEAWDVLVNDPAAVLVDVRTDIELQLIGKPDLSVINKEPVYLQWVTLQGVNPNFIEELNALLMEHGVTQDSPVFFMCQSGGRSKMSAMQCTEQGYTRCYNIAAGFEGELDDDQHRNSVSGWKVANLPWTQS